MCKEDQNENADVRCTVLCVTQYGHANSVKIMVTIGENFLSIDRFNQLTPGRTAHQHTWWYSQASPLTLATS
jgi:hypothetical protein